MPKGKCLIVFDYDLNDPYDSVDGMLDWIREHALNIADRVTDLGPSGVLWDGGEDDYTLIAVAEPDDKILNLNFSFADRTEDDEEEG